jgi:hypothetical protein
LPIGLPYVGLGSLMPDTIGESPGLYVWISPTTQTNGG